MCVCVHESVCVCLYVRCMQRKEKRHLFHLILDIQRAFLFMEEFQGLHVAMSRCVVDSIGSTLTVQEKKIPGFIPDLYYKIMLSGTAPAAR